MNELWNRIIENYKIARECLVYSKKKDCWIRQEDKGMYHLWTAYYTALNAEEKNHLFYARVLSLMGWEMQAKSSNYELLNKYYKPAVEQYDLALKENPKCAYPKEIENVRKCYEYYKYIVEKSKIRTDADYYNAIKLLEGHECLDEFSFHDSKFISFECDDQSAVLKLQYGDIYHFEFSDIYDVEMNCDPLAAYVYDFAIYQVAPDLETIVFDIEFLKIICKHITVHKCL